MKNLSQSQKQIYYPTIYMIIFFLFWEISCFIFKIPVYFLPSPIDIIDAFREFSEAIIENSIQTFYTTFVGFGMAIIFGREDRGLTNSELLLANKTFYIPTSQNNPSLNLSHAVSIVLYELNKSSKKNFNNWMTLTKKERYKLSKQDNVNYMDRRKLLLNEIRNEYKKISGEISKGNIKKK